MLSKRMRLAMASAHASLGSPAPIFLRVPMILSRLRNDRSAPAKNCVGSAWEGCISGSMGFVRGAGCSVTTQ